MSERTPAQIRFCVHTTEVVRCREVWRPVPGFETYYEVSDLGNVRSLHFGEPRPKQPRPNCDGYPMLVLYGGGKRLSMSLHRLVALTFHGDRRNALHNEVAHLDGDRTNARADNLKWASKVENHHHMRQHGTHPGGENHGHARLTADDVRAIRASTERTGALAGRFGVVPQHITDIRAGRKWRSVSTARPSIAIAVFCASYFLAAFVSAAGAR